MLAFVAQQLNQLIVKNHVGVCTMPLSIAFTGNIVQKCLGWPSQGRWKSSTWAMYLPYNMSTSSTLGVNLFLKTRTFPCVWEAKQLRYLILFFIKGFQLVHRHVLWPYVCWKQPRSLQEVLDASYWAWWKYINSIIISAEGTPKSGISFFPLVEHIVTPAVVGCRALWQIRIHRLCCNRAFKLLELISAEKIK